MDGLGECSCNAVQHACKAYASKPFSGWCEFSGKSIYGYPQVETEHYLNYTCTIYQLFHAVKYDADLETILDEWDDNGSQTITVSRNRYANDQTVNFGSVSGLYWGALNYFTSRVYGLPFANSFIWGIVTDNYGNKDAEEDYINHDEFMAEVGVIDPTYLVNIDGRQSIKDDYWVVPDPWIVPITEGSRNNYAKVSFWTFNNGVDGADGLTQWTVTTKVSEQLSSKYTISTCQTDQDALIAESDLDRLHIKATETDFTTSYCGYNNAGTIVFNDEYDGVPESTNLYLLADVDVSGIPVDVLYPWNDSTTRYNVAGPSTHVELYEAANVSMPQKAGGQFVNACIESKSIYIETNFLYTMITYEWLQNDEIGSGTNSDFQGVEGTVLEITADFEEAKTLTWGT